MTKQILFDNEADLPVQFRYFQVEKDGFSSLEKLCEAIQASGKAYNMEMIQKAYELANNAHNGVCRRSGEPYICHPLAVARLVLDLGMDSESIAAALLHDVVEDTPHHAGQLESRLWRGSGAAGGRRDQADQDPVLQH